MGESAKAVHEVFRKAKQAAPCIVFFHEIDAIVPGRASGITDLHVSERASWWNRVSDTVARGKVFFGTASSPGGRDAEPTAIGRRL